MKRFGDDGAEWLEVEHDPHECPFCSAGKRSELDVGDVLFLESHDGSIWRVACVVRFFFVHALTCRRVSASEARAEIAPN